MPSLFFESNQTLIGFYDVSVMNSSSWEIVPILPHLISAICYGTF